RADVVDGLDAGFAFIGRGLQAPDDADGVDRRRGWRAWLGPGHRGERCGTTLAQPETWRALPAHPPVAGRLAFRADRARETRADRLRAQELARDVVADVRDGRRLRRRREQRVERRDAVRL